MLTRAQPRAGRPGAGRAAAGPGAGALLPGVPRTPDLPADPHAARCGSTASARAAEQRLAAGDVLRVPPVREIPSRRRALAGGGACGARAARAHRRGGARRSCTRTSACWCSTSPPALPCTAAAASASASSRRCAPRARTRRWSWRTVSIATPAAACWWRAGRPACARCTRCCAKAQVRQALPGAGAGPLGTGPQAHRRAAAHRHARGRRTHGAGRTPSGKHARTEFRLVEQFGARASLLEATLQTGPHAPDPRACGVLRSSGGGRREIRRCGVQRRDARARTAADVPARAQLRLRLAGRQRSRAQRAAPGGAEGRARRSSPAGQPVVAAAISPQGSAKPSARSAAASRISGRPTSAGRIAAVDALEQASRPGLRCESRRRSRRAVARRRSGRFRSSVEPAEMHHRDVGELARRSRVRCRPPPRRVRNRAALTGQRAQLLAAASGVAGLVAARQRRRRATWSLPMTTACGAPAATARALASARRRRARRGGSPGRCASSTPGGDGVEGQPQALQQFAAVAGGGGENEWRRGRQAITNGETTA